MGYIKTDRLKGVLQSINGLVEKQVLVGIPDSTAGRKDEGAPLSNAEIGYIQENGAPEMNLPARPFLVPGVEAAQPKTLPQLQKGVEAALDGDIDGAQRRMAMAGLAAQSSVRARIESGIRPELKPATIANRARQRGTKSQRKSEKAYAGLIEAGAQAAGMSLFEIQSAAGIIPLVNTGQLRNAVTFVIRKRE